MTQLPRCNKCGRIIKEHELSNSLRIHGILGYYSEFDGDELDLDKCPECYNKQIHEWKDSCQINPVVHRERFNGYDYIDESAEMENTIDTVRRASSGEGY